MLLREFKDIVNSRISDFLCARFVFSVPLSWMCRAKIHHRDAKNTEDAQRLNYKS